MKINENTKRMVLYNVGSCMNIINELESNSALDNRYLYEINKTYDGAIQIIAIDSLTTSIALQICFLPKFNKINIDYNILLDFIADKNDSYNLNDTITTEEFEMYKKDLESVVTLEKVRYKRIFKICTLYEEDLYLDLNHKQFVSGFDNDGSKIEFRFDIITKDIDFSNNKTFGNDFHRFLVKAFIKANERIPEILFFDDKISIVFDSSRWVYDKKVYLNRLKMVIDQLKEFVKIFEKEIDIEKMVYENIDKYLGYIYSPRYFTTTSNIFKEYTIKPNISGIKTKTLFEIMEMIESEVTNSPARPKFVFKAFAKNKTIYIKIIDQKDGSIIFKNYLPNTDNNLRLIKNIKFVYRMFITDDFEVKESIITKIKKHTNTSFSDQVIVEQNCISLGLFPFITIANLPELPDGWKFDLQQFIYKSNKMLMDHELEKIASDFINWLVENTKYFKEEAI